MVNPAKDRLLKTGTWSLGCRSALRWVREVAHRTRYARCRLPDLGLARRPGDTAGRLPGGLQLDSGVPSPLSLEPGRRAWSAGRLEDARASPSGVHHVCLAVSVTIREPRGTWRRRVGVRTNFADLHRPPGPGLGSTLRCIRLMPASKPEKSAAAAVPLRMVLTAGFGGRRWHVVKIQTVLWRRWLHRAHCPAVVYGLGVGGDRGHGCLDTRSLLGSLWGSRVSAQLRPISQPRFQFFVLSTLLQGWAGQTPDGHGKSQQPLTMGHRHGQTRANHPTNVEA
jgi:hypothetical protein